MTVDLVARIQAGDVEAFETLYRQHSAKIYTLASRMAGSAEDGEDLLQEIFLQAYRKVGSFNGESALGTTALSMRLKSKTVSLADGLVTTVGDADFVRPPSRRTARDGVARRP